MWWISKYLIVSFKLEKLWFHQEYFQGMTVMYGAERELAAHRVVSAVVGAASAGRGGQTTHLNICGVESEAAVKIQ